MASLHGLTPLYKAPSLRHGLAKSKVAEKIALVEKTMVWNWFDGREAKQFGVELAMILSERIALEPVASTARLHGKKHDAMIHKLEQQVELFKSRHTLNIYKKAQVGNGFKWALKDKGYDPDYVDQLTSWLMLKI